jgi:ATP-dependent helicase HrpB
MLPILHYREKITGSLTSDKKLIVTAPPGTGKSTQIPQFLADLCSPEKKLLMLEPRRIASRSLAYRVAEEMGCACGGEVGYQVRFDRKVSEKTKILFLTYGTFIQLLHSDPLALRSSIIVFDEFHERSIEADMALAWVRILRQTARRDLEIMVLSATLEHGPLQEYLEGCAVIDVPDKAFPVDLRYQPPVSRHEFLPRQLERALAGLPAAGEQGSILAFLPGVYEIERAAETLYDYCRQKGYKLLRLHGRMPLDEQQQVLRLPGQEQCVILSTNVAETSLTVPGVTAVIDSGLARTASYDPERERNTLYLCRISLQNARQRTGRAGRLTEGICVRLWSREDERSMPETIRPEVLRLDLAKTMLTLCALSNSVSIEKGEVAFLTPPPDDRWKTAHDRLLNIKAISALLSSDKSICCNMPIFPVTELGRAISRLPLEPVIASVLLHSRSQDERSINTAMAAIWESGDQKSSESIDLFEQAMAFLEDRKNSELGKDARDTFKQLERIIAGETSFKPAGRLNKGDLREEVIKAWLQVFNHRLAVRTGDTQIYVFSDGRRARLDLRKKKEPFPPIILALAVRVQAGREQAKKVTIPLYLPLEKDWIAELFPDEVERKIECRWDEARQRVSVEELASFRGMALVRKEIEDTKPHREMVAACLAAKLVEGTWDWKKDDPGAEQYLFRIRQVACAYPEMEIPRMIDGDWELMYHGLCEGKRALEEVKKTSMADVMKSYIGAHSAGFIEKKAPDIIMLPSGKKGRVTYSENAPSELSARLGDLIGHRERFTLMDGRVQGIFNILAPNYRTVQKTADLGSFWKNIYPSIKNGLKRKYPKHPWP